MPDNCDTTIFKKTNGPYIRSMKGERFFDFSSSKNIIGFTDKIVTRSLKNNTTSLLNLNQKTIYHNRLLKIFNPKMLSNHSICLFSSLKELIYYFSYYYNGMDTKGQRDSILLDSLGIKRSDSIQLHDMAELFLNDSVQNISPNVINISNNYFLPFIDLNSINTKNEIIILPSLMSGYIDNVYVLISNELLKKCKGIRLFNQIPGYLIAHSLDFYHRIKGFSDISYPEISNDKLLQKSRLISFSNLDNKNIEKIYKTLFDHTIIINKSPPYYSYLPGILDENQKKKLLEQINDLF